MVYYNEMRKKKKLHNKSRNPEIEGTELRCRLDNHEMSAPEKEHRKHEGLVVNQTN